MTTLTHLTNEDTVAGKLGVLFSDAGFDLWIVGGAVRDDLMGRSPSEFDFATSAHPEQTKKLLREVSTSMWLQGERFGTVGATVDDTAVEVTTFRAEWYDPDTRKPEVAFGDSIETDLSRRDFTINCIAVQTPSGAVADPFGGIPDLLTATIRTPRDAAQAFTDDPLRMLRACRFVSTLSERKRLFQIDEPTKEAIAKMATRLAIVSAERIRDELSKLVCGSVPSAGLNAMTTTSLAEHALPELPGLAMEQDPINRHKDVFMHTLAVVERVSPDLVLRLGALLHDIGKPATREFGENGVSFHHHEVVGARMARKRLVELRFPTAVIDDVCTLVELHLRFHGYGETWTDSAVRRYVRDAGHLLSKLNELVRADCTTRNKEKAAKLAKRMDDLEARIAVLAEQEELDAIRPEIDGHDIMALFDLGPSRIVGAAREHMLEFRLENGPVGQLLAYAELASWGTAQGVAPKRNIEDAIRIADDERRKASEEATL